MDSIWRNTFSSSELSGEDEAEIEQMDTVDSYSEDGGEWASASSRIYLSMSWRNSNIPSWYMVMIRDPLTSWMISVVPRREKERGGIPERRGRR
jgi:hypothetical protein